jgi:hypothetical protein
LAPALPTASLTDFDYRAELGKHAATIVQNQRDTEMNNCPVWVQSLQFRDVRATPLSHL